MQRRPHIGFVTTSFPTRRGDPAGSFVFGMARAFARNGSRVEVVAPEPPAAADWHRNAGWLEGVRVIAAPYARPRALQKLFYGAGVPDNLASNPLRGAWIPPAIAGMLLAAAVRARRWDAVVSHWLLPSAVIAGVAGGRRIRHLAIAHSADVHALESVPFSAPFGGLLLRMADHLGFVSRDLRERFFRCLPARDRATARGRSSVTPMGVDRRELEVRCSRATLRKRLGIEGVTVLFLGRLVDIKGLDILIDAVTDLPVSLVIAGDGPLRQSLEARARGRVNARFLGPVGPEKRAELLNGCDILALPSRRLGSGRSEGLPLVVVEAQASGLPVVVSDTGGMSEIVAHRDTGLLVPPGDTKALRAAIGEISSDSNLLKKMGINGKRQASERDWRGLLPQYEKLLLA